MSSNLQNPYVLGSREARYGMAQSYGVPESYSSEIDELDLNTDSEPKSIDSDRRFGLVARIAYACLPVVGIILASIAEHAIMKHEDDTENKVECKNKFKISAIVNAILTMTLVVTAMALVILLNPPVSIGAMGAVVTLIHSPLFVGVAGAAVATGGIFITAKASSLAFNQKIIADLKDEIHPNTNYEKLVS